MANTAVKYQPTLEDSQQADQTADASEFTPEFIALLEHIGEQIAEDFLAELQIKR